MMEVWLSGFMVGAGFAIALRTALDWYVADYKRKHGQR